MPDNPYQTPQAASDDPLKYITKHEWRAAVFKSLRSPWIWVSFFAYAVILGVGNLAGRTLLGSERGGFIGMLIATLPGSLLLGPALHCVIRQIALQDLDERLKRQSNYHEEASQRSDDVP